MNCKLSDQLYQISTLLFTNFIILIYDYDRITSYISIILYTYYTYLTTSTSTVSTSTDLE